LTFGL